MGLSSPTFRILFEVSFLALFFCLSLGESTLNYHSEGQKSADGVNTHCGFPVLSLAESPSSCRFCSFAQVGWSLGVSFCINSE